MQANLFLYNMKDVEPKIRTKLHEKLFDRTKKSNYSSYAYENKGLLTKGDYIRPVRAVLIVKKEYFQMVADLFDANGIRYRMFEISILSLDFKKSAFF